MFYEGDLQSGIALALQQSKRVLCFVRDDGEESAQWEKEWLCEESLMDALSGRAVVLRINSDSPEATLLDEFCQIVKVPVIFVIYNGRLVDVITSGIHHDDFIPRVLKAVGAEEIDTEAPSEHMSPQEQHVSTIAAAQSASTSSTEPPSSTAATMASINHAEPNNSTPSPSTAAEALRAERDLRLEAESRHQPASSTVSNPPSTSSGSARSAYSHRQSYLEQQSQRKIEARKERERITAQIEADKVDRRAREAERKQQAELAREAGMGSSSSIKQPSARQKPASSQGTDVRLSVRLLDGATIRNTFPATAKLDPDIRAWISSQSPELAARPYTFRQILAPAPARTLSMSDEREGLCDMGLAPSATLVLVPLQHGSYVEAYGDAGSGVWSLLSVPRSVAAGAYGLVASGVDAVTGALGWNGHPPATQGQSPGLAGGQPGDGGVDDGEGAQAGQTRTQPGNVRIRTLADQRERGTRREQEFYNGNQTNFQSNDEDGDA